MNLRQNALDGEATADLIAEENGSYLGGSAIGEARAPDRERGSQRNTAGMEGR